MKKYRISIIMMILMLSILFIFLLFFFIGSGDNLISQDELSWSLKEKEIRNRLLETPIILYHNIDGRGAFSIDFDVLKSHFTLFREKGVNVVKLSELISRLEDPEPFDGKTMVITFDDGFFSMYEKLMPLVTEFGYPVTLFIYTDNIFNRARKNLTWEKVKLLENSGIEVECHSISHSDLLRLANRNTIESRKRLFDEIYLSKRIFEFYMGKKIQYFAFPYGRYDLKIIELCRKVGYRRVFSTDYGANIITRNNYCLRRQHVKKDYSIEFIEKVIH